MTLEIQINNDIKAAMIARDMRKLEALRSIKAALLLEKTGKDISGGEIPPEVELKLLQRLAKQRREAADIYTEKGRQDLAGDEIFQLSIIEAYLPAKMSEDDVRQAVIQIIEQTGATTLKDLGRVMGAAAKQLSGKADNKLVSEIAKSLLEA